MSINSSSDVRDFGKLPSSSQLSDIYLTPHLAGAAAEMAARAGIGYEAATGERLAAYKYSEACLFMASFLPVINSFYAANAPNLNREVAELEFILNSPSEVLEKSKFWRDQADDMLKPWVDDGGGQTRYKVTPKAF